MTVEGGAAAEDRKRRVERHHRHEDHGHPAALVGWVELLGIRNPFNLVALLPGAYYQPSPPFTGPVVRINGSPAGSETRSGRRHGWHQHPGPGRQSAEPARHGLHPGVDGSDQQLLGGIRAGRQRGDERHDEVGHQPVSRQLVRVLPKRSSQRRPAVHQQRPRQLVRPALRQNDYGFTLGGRCGFPKSTTAATRRFSSSAGSNSFGTRISCRARSPFPRRLIATGDFSGAIAAAGNKVLGTDPAGPPHHGQHNLRPAPRRAWRPMARSSPILFRTTRFPLSQLGSGRAESAEHVARCRFASRVRLATPPARSIISRIREAVSRDTEAPSLKLDQLIGSRDKLSFFWGRTATFTGTGYGEDGLPQPVSYTFGGGIYSHRESA